VLKTIHYRSHQRPAPSVTYKIYEPNLCVFSGEGRLGSTINFAEEIAQRIALAEGRSVESLRFFDLQTRRQYGKLSYPGPGDFEFDEVILVHAERPRAVEWRAAACPAEVLQAFADFIDGTPRQVGALALAAEFK